jgi:flagellar hook-associated protein FlgK
MTDLVSVAANAVASYQRALGTVSNNIANVSTDGYSRQEVVLQANPVAKVGTVYLGTGVALNTVKRQYDTFIEANLRNSNSDLESQGPMVNYANRVIDIMGSTSMGLSGALDQFFNAARDLSSDPASTVMRGSFVRDSENLASRFGELSAQLDLVQSETDEATKGYVNSMNTIFSQLAAVNTQLTKQKSASDQPPDLLDQRDVLLKDLSGYVHINTFFTENGSVTVSLGPSITRDVVVNGIKSYMVGTDFNSAAPEKVSLVLDPYGTPTPLSGLSGGKLSGLMSFREQVLGSSRSALDVLATNFVKETNAIHQGGIDAYGNPGTALFSIDDTTVGAAGTVKVVFKDALRVAAAAQFRVIEAANNTGDVDASIAYVQPQTNGPTTLTKVLANNPSDASAIAVRATVGVPFTGVTTVPNGFQNINLLMGEPDPGQQLQVFTRDGRQLVGAAINSDMQSLMLKPENGFATNATYSNAYLNVTGTESYKDLSVFYGAKADVGKQLRWDMAEADPAKHTALASANLPAQLISTSIQSGMTSIASGLFTLNGKSLTALDSSSQQSDVVIASTVGASTNTSQTATGNYNLYINGTAVSVGFVQGESVTDRLTKVANAINAKTNLHGTTATLGNGVLDLKATAASLSVWYDSDVQGLSAASFGLEKTGAVAQVAKLSIAASVNPGLPSFTEESTYLEFRNTGTAFESLRPINGSSADITNGKLSFFNNQLYLGNGTSASLIGQIDSTLNGLSGQPLRINYPAPFANADFSANAVGSTSITGWTTVNSRVKLDGTSTLAGFATPIDNTTAPNGGTEAENLSSSSTYTSVISSNNSTLGGSGNSVELSSVLSGVINTPSGKGGVVHGPALVSNSSVILKAGDTVSFDWQAQGGADAYDVYAYLVDINTGAKVQLLNQTGASATDFTSWARQSTVVPNAGNYKFVFVSGSWDATGGNAAGAKLFVDNITTTATTVAALTANQIADLKSSVAYNYSHGASTVINGTSISATATSAIGTAASISNSASIINANAATALANAINTSVSQGALKNVTASASGGDVQITSSVAGTGFALTAATSGISNVSLTSQAITSNSRGTNNVWGLSGATSATTGANAIAGVATVSARNSIQANDLARWVNAANVDGITATAKNELRIPVSQINLSLPLSITQTGIATPATTLIANGASPLANVNALVTAINNQSGVTKVMAKLTDDGHLILTNTTGFEGQDISIAATTATNALGLKPQTYGGQITLTRPLIDGKDTPIEFGFGTGTPADLAKLGFKTGAYIKGAANEDLLVFLTGAGDAKISASYSGAAADAKQAMRTNPLEVRFDTATRFTILDTKTGTKVAERNFNPLQLEPAFVYEGIQISFSSPPKAGDIYTIDGNRDGTGNNENMLQMIDLESEPVMGGGKTFAASYIDTVNDMGNIARQASIAQSALQVVYDQAETARDGVSGVSLDQEAADLIRYQQAYQAAAKILQISSQLFDSVLQVR